LITESQETIIGKIRTSSERINCISKHLIHPKMTKIKPEPRNPVVNINRAKTFQQYSYLHAAAWLKAAAKGKLQSPALLAAVAPWYLHRLAVHSCNTITEQPCNKIY
jgi:hypothetical protein